MTTTAEDPTPEVDAPSAAEVATKADMPKTKRRCPACATDRDCREMVDHSDDPNSRQAPFVCLTCGVEFIDSRR